MADTTQTTHDERHDGDKEQDVERGEIGSPNLGSETATLEAPEHAKDDHQQAIHKRDFGLVPIPKYLRVSKESPPHFDIFLNVLFGIGSTFSEWRVWDAAWELLSRPTLPQYLVAS